MSKIFVLTGPPASGKTTIKNALRQCGVATMISHTTRAPKEHEKHGVHYFFVTKEEFLKLRLVERVTYAGHFYGLSKDEVMSKLEGYPATVVDTDLQGLQQLRKLLGDRVECIFILTDKDTILGRLTLQGEYLETIIKRIEFAEENGEFDNWKMAESVVKNTGDVDKAVRQVLAIMNLP